MLKPISHRAARIMGVAIAIMEARLIAAEADMKLTAFFRNLPELVRASLQTKKSRH
jgi:hypothetical protein